MCVWLQPTGKGVVHSHANHTDLAVMVGAGILAELIAQQNLRHPAPALP